jgi:F-type H+-transporting ATPase subunit b
MSFLSVNGTVVVQLINFLIFFAVLNVVFLRPVSAAIRRRRAYINSLVTDYDRYQGEARTLREQAERIRAAARRESEQTIAQARSLATNDAAEITVSHARQAHAIVEEATSAVNAELESARAVVESTARKLSELMLERIIPEKVA